MADDDVVQFLPPHDLRVLEVCRGFVAEGQMRATIHDIAHRAGLSVENTRRAIELLRRLGLVVSP